MTKGLKQMVEEAMHEEPEVKPVEVSGEAHAALAQKLREWTGWRNARLVLGDPKISPFASTEHTTRTFTINPETLVLNPNRVLLTVTPFRLRQEAVLTGAMLHEAGHARHTLWKPRTEAAVEKFRHSDDTPVTKQEFALASLMEEPRIEGLVASEADRIGAEGLGWTMRASAAQLVPMTTLATDPAQKMMDLITSWALRAGRQVSLAHHTGHRMATWVGDFNSLLHTALVAHLTDVGNVSPISQATDVMNLLTQMIFWTGVDKGDWIPPRAVNTGPFMVDRAREVLAILFPETDGDSDEAPMPGGCTLEMPPDDEQSEDDEEREEQPGGDEQSEQGEQPEPEEDKPEGDSGDDESEDEGSGSESDDDESDEGDADEGEGSGSESDEPGDDEPESDESGGDGASDSTEEGEGDGAAEPSELEQALAEMEAAAKSDTEDETEDEADKAPPLSGGAGAGEGGEGTDGEGWRNPTKTERDVQKGAERFLRDLIAPSESSHIVLTEAPSATVDGAAMAAWKAGGQIRDPRFFRRVQRQIEPSPPVKIAILVDVSGSMDELQKPSALLSWALAAAALDLRNFAGRGQMVESTLIHWGSRARVIQGKGEVMHGIKEFECFEGTSALHSALGLVEQEIPGFFDTPDRPINRLLVNFTDWELNGHTHNASVPFIQRALASGVNMLNVVPRDYSPRRSDLSGILALCKEQRGGSHIMQYNPMFPEQVWDEASNVLG